MSELEQVIRATLADPPDAPAPGPELIEAAIGRVRSRRRIRRAGAVAGLLVAVAAIVLVAAALVGGEARRPPTTSLNAGPPSTTGGAPTSVASATVDQLRRGQWAAIPAAPIPSRDGASVVWTGRELVVWGGQARTNQLRADGAAYAPGTGQWRTLPVAPLSPRTGQAAVWTGTELVVWGGYDQASGNQFHVTADGAAYNPATDRWRMLAPSTLSARTFAQAVWTGRQVIFLGGQPAELTGTIRGFGDGAFYDPVHDRWQRLVAPVPPAGHPLVWRTAVQAGTRLLAFSEWAMSRSTGPSSSEEWGGLDLFSLDEQTARWQAVPTGSGMLPDVVEALWTGRLVVERGVTINCGFCSRPFVPEASALYDPAANHWISLPADPLGGDHLLSAWTGAALFSLNPGGTYGTVQPGNASAYDPVRNGWSMLPSAPSGCGSEQPPIWTGTQLLLYCPQAATGPGSGHSGLVFTAGRTAPPPSTQTGLQVRLKVPSTQMVAGSSMPAQVTVDNPGPPVTVEGCLHLFAVVLRSDAVPQTGGFLQCREQFVIPPGHSTYPVTTDATYVACGQNASGHPLDPQCLPGNKEPPLPPGRYQAVVANVSGLPDPAPLEVTLTPATR